MYIYAHYMDPLIGTLVSSRSEGRISLLVNVVVCLQFYQTCLMNLSGVYIQVTENAILQYRSVGAEKMVALEELQKLLANAEARISEGELLRRKLHNTILVCFLYMKLVSHDIHSAHDFKDLKKSILFSRS